VSKLDVARERPQGQVEDCESCGSEHLPPVPCGLSFKERIRTARFGSDWMPARRAAHSFVDRSALDETFGPDRRERMLHETRGLGPVRTADDGTPWVYDDPKTGEMRPMESSDLVGGYLRGTPDEELHAD